MDKYFKVIMADINGRALHDGDQLLEADDFEDAIEKYLQQHDDPRAVRGLIVITLEPMRN